MSMVPIPSQRRLFDIPHDVAYFNCAYNAPQLNETRSKLLEAAVQKSRPWQRTPRDFFDDAEAVRRLAAGLFGGDIEGYALVPAASYGLSAAARAVEPQLHADDDILVMAEEFPSNILPWRRVARERGAALRTVPAPEDGDWTQAILERIDERIKVVAVSSCHWTNGARIDLRRVAAACRATGSLLVVDATQTLGAMPLCIREVQPDFLVAAGYKWLLCPYGFGLLYVAEQWRDARPLEESWLARDNAEDFTALVKYSDAYLPGARRFEVGEKCTTLLPGAIAALEQIKSWGIERIAETLSQINHRIAAHLDCLAFRLPSEAQSCPHMFGAHLPLGYTGNLVTDLRTRGIHISQRGDALRFAPHLHVNDHDVDRLLEALSELVR